ncbi:phage tail tape measure protein [Rhizobium sp. CFBP 8762]|uniref:phage tail tape measure protein n=1 Tax=Rhizobium sp. CFBP 8762 TaxID=2775279 RepID=UPI00177D31C1|nr:phage tail tape measure protein [Rhizobium sp. CFBP 8762]MBD8554921.1 phage tail tape measure protein [Rhizobium sp. CFBP 8762]
MARGLNLDVLVRLRDRLSAPLKRLTASLQKLSSMGRKIGVVGAAVATISFMGPIAEAAEFEQKLLNIAATSHLSGKKAFAFVAVQKEQYEGLALEIGQFSQTIADGAAQMIAAGVDQSLVDASIKNIGRAATASTTQFSDMAGVATSLLTTLKLPADQLNNALGGLVTAGKLGAFEMKDMAKYFPTLTGQMAKFGVTGREAVNFLGAALQIARKGTSDPAEAANNLKNFLAKITSPETIKNFKDMGVDIGAVMQDAATKGINPIEAVVQKITKLTGVSGAEIQKLMARAKAGGMEGADALGYVREQLEKIHGAGALGELFADMQVMDFLIPMLGNIDEYKRIKEEVAQATGGVIDEDFITQMQALNQQTTIFLELGRQAAREVGFAFGSWLPVINKHLTSLIAWLRELDAQTGGKVRQFLAFAGAGVLLAVALGALAIVLPVIGAGLSLIGALVSPIGLALAAIAAGAYAIYKNWDLVGPHLSNVWTSAKAGLTDLASAAKQRAREFVQVGREMVARYGPTVKQGMATAWDTVRLKFRQFVALMWGYGRQIVGAGRDMVSRYGPMIKRGMMTAWTDIKQGWKGLKSFFEGIKTGMRDFKIDTSGWTIDNAKVVIFERIDGALGRIKLAWEALKSFGSGFGAWLPQMGGEVGEAITTFAQLGDAFGRIGTALSKMSGADTPKISGFFKTIGDLAGGSLTLALDLLNKLGDVIVWLAESLATLIEAISKGINWSAIIPNGVAEALNSVATAINAVKTAWNSLGNVAKPGDMLPNGTPAGSSNDGSDRDASADDFLNGPPRIPGPSPQKHSSIESPTKFAALQRPATQQVAVGGVVRVDVTGPGKVVGSSSDNKAVPIKANTGRAIGRA